MMPFSRTVLALACLLPAAAQCADFTVRRGRDAAVVFSGAITPRSATALLREMERGMRTLVVTSAGGDFASALALGQELRRRAITLRVRGYCASSCANYLFLGAPRKSLEPGSFLGFHGAMSARLSRSEEDGARAGGAAGEGIDALFGQYARQELQFLAASAVDSALFKHALVQTDAVLAQKGRAKTSDFRGGYRVVSAAGTEVFKAGEEAQMQAAIAGLERDRIAFTAEGNFELVSGGDVSDIAYFPSRATLERYGVTGLTRYPYPASAAMLRKLVARRLPGAAVRGDFTAATPAAAP